MPEFVENFIILVGLDKLVKGNNSVCLKFMLES